MTDDPKKQVFIDRDFGHIVRDRLQSSIEVKASYTPDDVAGIDYENDVGDPGAFPFTRGIYPEMFRKRLWIKSFIVSYATPEETNAAFKELIASGQTGLRFDCDLPLQTGLDPDHPSSYNAMMCGGASTYALNTWERMLADIPLEGIDFELAHSSICNHLIFYCMLPALMENQGLDITKLRGNTINDPFRAKIVYNSPDFTHDMNRRVCVDLVEWAARHAPKWYGFAPNGVDPQQTGANVFQETAGCLGCAMAVYDDLINDRGLTLDEIGATAFSMDAESDFFETIAKFRAIRRMWAKIAKNRYNAKTKRAMSLRIGIRTSGLSLQAQKPLNNAARVTLQILSCVLGGVNSVDASSIDEAIGLPSPEARQFNLDAQHIVTHEANVPLTADPLGGSYYLEWLTDRIEQGANEYLQEIEQNGGMWDCLKSGFLRRRIEESRLVQQEEKSRGERLIVGVNAFQGPEGPISQAIKDCAYKVPTEEARERNIAEMNEMKANRDDNRLAAAMTDLYRVTREGGNVVRPTIEAVKAYATVGEITGLMRLAYDQPYDPLNVIEAPELIKKIIE